MEHVLPRRVVPALLAVGVVLTVSACGDRTAPTQPSAVGARVARVATRPGAPIRIMYGRFASAASSANISGSGISYHGGPILKATKVQAMYWASSPIYNGEPAPGTIGSGAQDGSLIGFFLNHLGGSPYFNINTTYYDNSGDTVQNSVTYTSYWADNSNVPPSNDTYVAPATIDSEISRGLNLGVLSYDSSTVYLVLASGQTDFNAVIDSGGCAYHTAFPWKNHTVIYAAMPELYAIGVNCLSGLASPNADPAADAEVNALAHEIEESTTDYLGNAWWFNGTGEENADTCRWTWGTTYDNGVGVANMNLGGKDFLIQRNWLNQSGWGCVQNFHNDGFYVMGISVPSPIKSAGWYYPYATLSEDSSGAVTYQWIASYSNGVLPPDTSAWVQNGAWGFYAPWGNYTIYLYVTARDVLGNGYPTTEFLRVVCTSSSSPTGVSPNLPNGCNPPPSAVALKAIPGPH